MTSRAGRAYLRISLLIAGLLGSFVLLQERCRTLEAQAAAAVLRALGADVGGVVGTSVYIAPSGDIPFYAILTPSCSALASVLAIGCLATLVPASSQRRRFVAAGVALSVVVIGNILRIVGSLGLGVVAGRSSLILFHDSVGNIFSFAYTLGGYIIMLFLLLPARPQTKPSFARPPEGAAVDPA